LKFFSKHTREKRTLRWDDGAHQHGLLEWVVRLRWVAIVFLSVMGLLGFRFVFLSPMLAWPYALTLVILTLFNVYSTLELKVGDVPRPRELAWHWVMDSACLGFLLALTGGTRNPFVLLFLVHATLGAFVFATPLRHVVAVLNAGILFGVFLARDWQVLSSNIYLWNGATLFALAITFMIAVFLAGSFSEVLAMTRSKLEMVQRQRRARDHLLALGALSAEFAHEFASPLNEMQLRLDRVMRQSVPSEDMRALEDAVERTIGLLKRFSEAPSELLARQFEKVDLGAVMKRVAGDWAAAHPTVAVRYEGMTQHPVWVQLPPDLFSKALVNVLDNAAYQSALIDLATKELDKEVHLLISDHGPGWPAEMLESGVRPHFSTRPGGTGLGLFNCQSLCEVLGGSLEISGNEAGGAVVRIRLPKIG
jgi:two-component system, sensor histidine kinase RegB